MSQKLTDLQLLSVANDNMVVYVAYQGGDYALPLGIIKQLITLPTRDSLGISNVDNTSDLDKPISRDVAQALARTLKDDSSIAMSQITNLVQTLAGFADKTTIEEALALVNTALEGKRDENTPIAISEVALLEQALLSKADASHSHTGLEQAVSTIIQSLSEYARANHTHEISEVSGLSTELNNRPTTQAMNLALAEKADANHRHQATDIDGVEPTTVAAEVFSW